MGQHIALRRKPAAPAMTTIRNTIDTMAQRHAQIPFLLSPESKHELNYRDLQTSARSLSARLLAMGLAKGEKVAFALENGLYVPQLILGAMYGGFVPVPINTVAGVTQAAHVLNHSEARVVFVSEKNQAMLDRVIEQLERAPQIISVHPDFGPDWPGPEPTQSTLPPVQGDDDAMLVYTSGSTGSAKGVVYSQQSIQLNGLHTSLVFELSTEDRVLCVMPLYHMSAVATLFANLLSGGSLVIPHQFSVAHYWQWVADYRCTWLAVVPTIISHLVNWTDPNKSVEAARLDQIRFVRCSSAPLAPALHQAFEAKFNLLLVEAMGMTEAGTVFMNPLSRELRRIGSPGWPIHEMKIVDRQDCPVAPGQAGEILLRGPSLMKGYYKNPQATAQVLSADGWLRTGDLGYQDRDGYVFIVGRAKEIVIKGGENIAPREIDEVLMCHDSVLEAAAVGVPDAILGEDLVAYVVLKPGRLCSEQELLTHSALALGEFKTPSRIHFVEDLPKGSTGKVQRLRLREREQAAQIATILTSGSAPLAQPDSLVPPTALEQKLTSIWEKVLAHYPIGRHDNFFAMGGHSLAAVGIIARVRDTCSVSLPLRVLFEAPTIAAMAQYVETARHTGASLPQPPVLALSRDRVVPLSFAQKRLWFLHQLDPDSTEYNIANLRHFTGPLNQQAFEQSLAEIIQRHASLRTSFPVVESQPIQLIAPSLGVSLTRVDLVALGPAQQQLSVQQYAQLETRKPFDLATGPLFRATLLHLAHDDHVFIFTMHHIISDRWSMEVFFGELGALYCALVAGLPSPLPALPVQYADLAAWEQQWLQGEVLEKELAYWHQQLADAPPLLAIPTDYPRPAVQTHRGRHYRAIIPGQLTRSLNALSRQEGCTLFMTLLAAFQVLLARYTGQDDIVVGSPTANRTRLETEPLIGFFVNMLVLRTKLSDTDTFRVMLKRVREVALGAYAHQAVPFEKLVQALQPSRSLDHAPLFQVIFHLRNVPEKAAQMTNLRTESLRFESGTAQFDLSFALHETSDHLEVEVEYATDLFAEPTITRLVGHYQTLLEGVIANPAQSIAKLPLLTHAERQQLLGQFDAAQPAESARRCIHERFEDQVERTPDAIALVYQDQQLSYRELNRRANGLAHYLRAQGAGPEVLVGLYMQRSLEMVICILAILKAGAAYLPLDPEYPTRRVLFMLEDAQATLLLTHERTRSDARAIAQDAAKSGGLGASFKVVEVDGAELRDWQQENADASNPVSGVTANHLAYVIYTSGSTGKPKGTLVSHHNVVRLFQSTASLYEFTSSDTWILFHSSAFDVSVWEIWGALFTGAKLLVISYRVSRAPAACADLITEHGVTVLNQTPSAFRQLMPYLLAKQAPHQLALRYVIFAGEALDVQSLRAWFDRYGDQTPQMINMYGITETTVHVTYRRLLRSDLPPGLGSAIGKPLADLRVCVLDAHQQLVPIGVPGELYVGGAGVSRGYLSRPELTAARFVRDPFGEAQRDLLGDAEQTPIYRSGDLVRWRENGELEYLGRIDQQIKLRGFRIELGEIEAVLGLHPGVRQAVACLREDSPGDKRVVAYVVTAANQKLSHSELQSFLRTQVAEYMIPAAFVFLATIPLTVNGKLDRQALPPPEPIRPELTQCFVAPRNRTEQIIAQTWCEVLGLQQIGVHDDFFDLGGHSLKVIQVTARLRNTLQVNISVRKFFESPTIAGLATHLDADVLVQQIRLST